MLQYTHPVGWDSNPSRGDIVTFGKNTPRKSILILSIEGGIRGCLPHMYLYNGAYKAVSHSLNKELSHLTIERITKRGFDLITYLKQLNKTKTIYD